MIYKTLLRKQKTGEHESHQITGGELGCFGGVSVPALNVTPVVLLLLQIRKVSDCPYTLVRNDMDVNEYE